jgi:hypothetical protein
MDNFAAIKQEAYVQRFLTFLASDEECKKWDILVRDTIDFLRYVCSREL